MQIHTNNVLIIDSIKNQIFLMGGAGVTHIFKRASTRYFNKLHGQPELSQVFARP
jgi:hypothetical protein